MHSARAVRCAVCMLTVSYCAACEDLQEPGGAIALVCSSGIVEWFSKGYEVYGSAHDDDFYLNLTKDAVHSSTTADILGIKLLSRNYSHLTWELVASAVPPIRNSGGARAFTGSRGSSVDTTFSGSSFNT